MDKPPSPATPELSPRQPQSAQAIWLRRQLGMMFAALKHRNYRLWFAGQLVSLFGTWMQSTAQGYLVFQLTHSPAYLGYVGFAAGVPSWLFTLYGGVIADRIPRRTLLVITQTTMMVLAFILAALAFLNVVRPWHIIVLAFGLGVANAFDAPARQAMTVELVDRREDLTNAIALNSAMFNTATFVGPAAAGLTYALFGPGWCFLLNGISFIAVIAALLLMRFSAPATLVRRRKVRYELRDGVQYVLSQPTIAALIGVVGLTSLFGISFVTLIPAWAVDILHGDATTSGLLYSARGAGALLSALLIAALGRFKFKGKLLTIGTFAFPITLLIFATLRWLPLSLLVLAGAGLALILIVNLANALVQTHVPDDLRGRVMGIYTFVFFGLMPLGSLLVGGLAQGFDEPTALVICSLISLAWATLILVFMPRLRALE